MEGWKLREAREAARVFYRTVACKAVVRETKRVRELTEELDALKQFVKRSRTEIKLIVRCDGCDIDVLEPDAPWDFTCAQCDEYNACEACTEQSITCYMCSDEYCGKCAPSMHVCYGTFEGGSVDCGSCICEGCWDDYRGELKPFGGWKCDICD